MTSLLVHDRNIFRSSLKVLGNRRLSPEIFGDFRKMFENVRATFDQILESLRKSSESGWKSSENRQKRRYQYLSLSIYIYIKNKIIHGRYYIGISLLVFNFISYSFAALIVEKSS